MNTREKSLAIFNAAVDAVHPKQLLKNYLHSDDDNIRIGNRSWIRKDVERLVVIAIGKAASSMAQEAEILLGEAISYGICITKHGHAMPLKKIILHEAGHPVPDRESVEAAMMILQMIEGSSQADVILVLLSGGASSLLADIPPGCSLTDYQTLNVLLINNGLAIDEINTVRKNIATLKGGRLLQHANPATVITLAISDVIHDDVSTIGSGLTVPYNTNAGDAVKILNKYHLWNKTPASIQKYLGDQSIKSELKDYLQYNSTLNDHQYYLVGNNEIAINAAKAKASELGYNAVIFKKNLDGDAEKNARLLVQQLKDFRGQTPACFILGGETTVVVNGDGKGGRCQHFVLAAANELLRLGGADIHYSITLLAAGTDGTDGPTDAAGAFFDKAIASESDTKGLSTAKYLQSCKAYDFFKQTGGLIKTSPTQTNVGDIILFVID